MNVDKMCFIFFFQAEDGIRASVASRGLGDVYKRQILDLLEDIQREMHSGIILITHDLGVVAETADPSRFQQSVPHTSPPRDQRLSLIHI